MDTRKHSTYSDAKDVSSVVSIDNLSTLSFRREKATHVSQNKLEPLKNWSKQKCIKWIDQKKQDFLRFKGSIEEDSSESDTDSNED